MTGQFRNVSVLVVEDQPPVQDVLRKYFQMEGASVKIAPDGRKAIDLLQTGFTPDVITSDFAMPNMKGFEFYEALEADFPHLTHRVIFVTGGSDSDEFEKNETVATSDNQETLSIR